MMCGSWGRDFYEGLKEDLRELTRRAALRAVQKLGSRLSQGEKKNRKRMATVAAVYDVAPPPL